MRAVLKVLSGSKARNPQTLARFQREGRLLTQLNQLSSLATVTASEFPEEEQTGQIPADILRDPVVDDSDLADDEEPQGGGAHAATEARPGDRDRR